MSLSRGEQRTLSGDWVPVNVTDDKFKLKLPPRQGCRIQRWPLPNNKVRWQAWHPPNKPGEAQSVSVTADGETGCDLVLVQVWKLHKKFLKAASSAGA